MDFGAHFSLILCWKSIKTIIPKTCKTYLENGDAGHAPRPDKIETEGEGVPYKDPIQAGPFPGDQGDQGPRGFPIPRGGDPKGIG